jgi:lysophospholipase L1-like esterase
MTMRKKRTLTKLLLVILAVFLILEILLRGALFFNGMGFFRERRFISPFFTLYDTPAPLVRGGELYFKRGQKIKIVKPDNTVRIFCLGGSTTVSANTRGHYPQLMQDKLNRSYKNVHFEVMNAAGDAFSSAHSFVNFALRLSSFHPDCIIVYHNINDLSVNYFGKKADPDYANKYMNNLFLAPECKLGIQKYFFGSRMISYLMMVLNNYAFQKQAMRIYGDIDISEGRKVFRRNLEDIIILAKARGIKVVLATQAACFAKSKSYPYIRKNDFLSYNETVKDLASQYNLDLVDCFRNFRENEDYFVDLVHYTETGVEKLSDEFFRKIAKIYPDAK